MKHIFITGMSGTGKSSVLEELRSRGFTAIDTDDRRGTDDGWCELSVHNGDSEWILREDRMYELFTVSIAVPLFVSGCSSNQWKFYNFFDYKVLFSAPLEVILDRMAKRASNPYGKSDEERAEICWNFEHVQPLLKKGVDLEIDSAHTSISEVAEFLIELAFSEDIGKGNC